MNQNYYCNGHWFKTYDEAKMYADKVVEMGGKYHVVFTKAEKDSIINVIDHVMDCPAIDGFACHCEDIINHELECGK